MDDRIEATLDALGIRHLAERDPGTLSGGEQQRVAIASIAAMDPRVLVLDEPTAELDPSGTAAVVELLVRLQVAGTTILCTEHSVSVLEASDRVAILDGGRLVDVPPTPVDPGPLTWDVGSARRGVTVSLDHVTYRYPDGVEALRDVSLEVAAGEAVAIIGPNGSGKTTLAKQLNGLLRPTSGRVRLGGTATDGVPLHRLAALCGFAFQDPGDQLFERSVEREVGFGPRQRARTESDATRLVDAALAMTGLDDDRRDQPVRPRPARGGSWSPSPACWPWIPRSSSSTNRRPVRIPTASNGSGGSSRRCAPPAGRSSRSPTTMAFAERWFDWVVVMESGRVASDHPARGA